MLKEFRDFLLRGNVIDLAVAVIIGAAFSAIVNSLVADIIMPLIGILMGGVDLTSLTIQVGSATIAYGNFLQAVINFLLIGLTLFLVIKGIRTAEAQLARRKLDEKQSEPPSLTEDILLLREIRDLLRK